MKPMMALPTTIEDIEAGKLAGYVMEPKLDGMRLLLHFPQGGLSRALTRSGRDVFDRLPQGWVGLSSDFFRQFWRVTGLEWLDCEFGYGTGAAIDFNKTMRVMGSSPAEAQRKAQEIAYERTDATILPMPWPTAFIFDLPELDKPLGVRRQRLEEVFEKVDTSGVELVAQMPQYDENYFNMIVSGANGEGIMLKNPNSMYEQGKRKAKTWYKLKKYDTFEGFVVGFDPGQGKYEGLIGAVVVRTQDGIEVRCSGMTDEERLRITAQQDRIVREQWVLEVKHFGLTAGTPRHPQFLRWRPDKPAAECYFNSRSGSNE